MVRLRAFNNIVGRLLVLERGCFELDGRQALYYKHFGKKRTTFNARIDAGVPGKKHDGADEKSWLSNRRAAVMAAVPTCPASTVEEVLASACPDVSFTGKQQELYDKQVAKAKRRKVQAYLDNSLLADEIEEDLAANAAVEIKERMKRTKERAAKKKRVDNVMKPKTSLWMELQGKPCFIEESDIVAKDEIAKAMAEWGCRRVDERKDARVFIAVDPSNPGMRTRWSAVMMGAWIVSDQVLVSRGEGAILKYRPAVAKRRKIFFTQAFKDKHPVVFKIIAETAETFNKRTWRLRKTLEERRHRQLTTTAAETRTEITTTTTTTTTTSPSTTTTTTTPTTTTYYYCSC